MASESRSIYWIVFLAAAGGAHAADPAVYPPSIPLTGVTDGKTAISITTQVRVDTAAVVSPLVLDATNLTAPGGLVVDQETAR